LGRGKKEKNEPNYRLELSDRRKTEEERAYRKTQRVVLGGRSKNQHESTIVVDHRTGALGCQGGRWSEETGTKKKNSPL